MGVDVNIYLEPHAKTEQIFEVMLKILGSEFEQKVFNGDKQPDFEQNPSLENKWYLVPVVNPDNKIELKNHSYFDFSFKSCNGEHFSCLIHLDCDEGHISVCKALMPPSTATWCAIGKKLVDFFGGKLVYSDSKDEDDPKNYYLVKKGKFLPRKKNDDPNERFYLYYELLNNVNTVTAHEIKYMSTHSAYFNDRDKNMIFFLEKLEAAQELSKELNKQPFEEKSQKNKKTLKV